MSLSAKIRRAPVRAAAGAYILNSGVGKLSADDETAKRLHSAAGNSYGFVDKLDPKMFTKVLAAGEIAVGGVLLLPIVPPIAAGAALAGFSGLLLKTYWETPGVHQDGNPRPTPAGSGMAKDVWMLGMGAGLILDATLSPAHDKKVEVTSTVAERRGGRARRKAKKAAKQARAETRAQLVAMAKEQQSELNKRARKAAKQARKSALDTAAHTRASAEETSKQARKSAAKAAKRTRKSDAAKRARELAEQTRAVAVQGRERAADAAHRVAEAASTATERAQDATTSARDAAQQAAGRVKQAAA
jgi:hypothetical protein